MNILMYYQHNDRQRDRAALLTWEASRLYTRIQVSQRAQ